MVIDSNVLHKLRGRLVALPVAWIAENPDGPVVVPFGPATLILYGAGRGQVHSSYTNRPLGGHTRRCETKGEAYLSVTHSKDESPFNKSVCFYVQVRMRLIDLDRTPLSAAELGLIMLQVRARKREYIARHIKEREPIAD